MFKRALRNVMPLPVFINDRFPLELGEGARAKAESRGFVFGFCVGEEGNVCAFGLEVESERRNCENPFYRHFRVVVGSEMAYSGALGKSANEIYLFFIDNFM